jgi:hypothetical protein
MSANIAYEKADIENLIDPLKASRIEVLVDIREHAQSWKPGLSKTRLAEVAQSVGIEYMHFRTLGDPKASPDATRTGLYLRFNAIFRAVMETPEAESAVQDILVRTYGRYGYRLNIQFAFHTGCRSPVFAP